EVLQHQATRKARRGCRSVQSLEPHECVADQRRVRAAPHPAALIRPADGGRHRPSDSVLSRFRVLRGGFMRKRFEVFALAIALMISCSGLVTAQTTDRSDASEWFPVVSSPARPLFTPDRLETYFAEQPAGPPPTPRHTGIKTMAKHLVTNFKYLPSMENLFWAGLGGGLALAAHPFDDNVNEALVGSDTADHIFKAGEVLGEL